MAKALYSKYRPRTLEDVVGQKHVITTFQRAKEANKFSHAYLFAGNYGCGKTTVARILASMVTCDNEKDASRVLNGMSVDVKELDGATNRGIDDIRELIDGAQWSPIELKGKAYIIDEFHQLSKEATSALLKILEEPPTHLTFILCTTESNKILPTIFSRCQRFIFSKISSKEIVNRLVYIAKEEKINVDEEAIFLLAKMGRGSMRDAICYLEQIATIADGKAIVGKHVQQYFGISDRNGIYDIVKSIINCNIATLLDQVNDLVMVSGDPKQIMYDLSEVFRNVMLLKAHKNDTSILDLPDHELEILTEIAGKVKISQLSRMAKLFADIEKKINYNLNDRWIMEATLIDCAALLRQNT